MPGAHQGDSNGRQGGICRSRKGPEEVLRQLKIYDYVRTVIDSRRTFSCWRLCCNRQRHAIDALVTTLRFTLEQWASLILLLLLHCLASTVLHCFIFALWSPWSLLLHRHFSGLLQPPFQRSRLTHSIEGRSVTK